MSEAADTETARAVKKPSRRALSYLLALTERFCPIGRGSGVLEKKFPASERQEMGKGEINT